MIAPARTAAAIDSEYRAAFQLSEAMYRRAETRLPSGIAHDARYLEPFPLYVESASGARKRTIEGVELLDFAMGHGSLLFGHNPEYAIDILDRCNRTGAHFSAGHPDEVEWAERICELVPCAERVRFALTGTEATMLALRLARAATGRGKILRLAGHFHGWHDYALLGLAEPFDRPSSAGIPPETLSTVVVAAADPDAIEAVLAGGEIAALILEPAGGGAGSVPLGREFLEEVRALTGRAGTLLIFDEVVTGFRWAPGGAQEWFGVTPDLTTLGKILAGGLPGAAVAGRSEVLERMAFRQDADWNRFSRVAQYGTWNAFHHSAALGAATLARLGDGVVQESAARLAERLRGEMQAKLRESGLSGCVYGGRSMVRVALDAPGALPDLPPDEFLRTVPPESLLRSAPPQVRQAVWKASLLEGVDWMGGTHGWVSAAHTEEDVDFAIRAFERALRRVAEDLAAGAPSGGA